MDKVYKITMTLETEVKEEVIARDDDEALDKLNEELYAALDEYTNEGLLYISDVSIEEDEEATAMMRADEKMQELEDEV